MKYHYIQVQINTNHQSPYFTGSMLRGALGYALKKVTCINPSYLCNGCFSQSSCIFYHFYELQNILHNYRFEITLDSDDFDFGLYLFGDACDSLPYILSALEMMLTQIGLTKDNIQFDDITIYLNQKSIYQNNSFSPLDISPQIFQIDNPTPNIKIKLLTPLRIKKHNKFLRDSVDIEDILRSIYQREQEIFYNKKVFKLDYEPSYTTTLNTLNYKSLTRKSNRQKTKMSMDGIIGEIAIMGIDERSYRLLKLGEIIGVGKQTVMGLGNIRVI